MSNSKSTYDITRKVLTLHHFSSNYILSTSSIPEGIARLYMILKYTANDLSISIYQAYEKTYMIHYFANGYLLYNVFVKFLVHSSTIALHINVIQLMYN